MKKILSVIGHVVTPILGLITFYIGLALGGAFSSYLSTDRHGFGGDGLPTWWADLVTMFLIGAFVCCVVPRFLTRRNAIIHSIINGVIINILNIVSVIIYWNNGGEFRIMNILMIIALICGCIYGTKENIDFDKAELWE